jgi:hypothetical protein
MVELKGQRACKASKVESGIRQQGWNVPQGRITTKEEESRSVRLGGVFENDVEIEVGTD